MSKKIIIHAGKEYSIEAILHLYNGAYEFYDRNHKRFKTTRNEEGVKRCLLEIIKYNIMKIREDHC